MTKMGESRQLMPCSIHFSSPFVSLKQKRTSKASSEKGTRIREASPSVDSEVGITLNLVPAEPASQSQADQQATDRFDTWFNRWYLDPLNGRGYPKNLVEEYQADHYIQDWSFIQEGDLDTIAAPIDFLGINYYTRGIIRNDKVAEEANDPVQVIANPESTDITAFNPVTMSTIATPNFMGSPLVSPVIFIKPDSACIKKS